MCKEAFGECGAVCYDKECNKTYTEKEYNEDMSEWSIDHNTGFYFCPSCKIYLSVSEDIDDIMNSCDMHISFDIILDSVYMLIDTYKSYKAIEENDGQTLNNLLRKNKEKDDE